MCFSFEIAMCKVSSKEVPEPEGKQKGREEHKEVREVGDAPFRGSNPSPETQNMHPLEMHLIKN